MSLTAPSLIQETGRLIVAFANGCEVVIDTRGNAVAGLRHVTFHGKPLRSPQEAIWPEIATPDGREIERYELLDARVEDGCVVIETRPWWRTAHRMEWQEHGGHQRIATTSWSNGAWCEDGQRMTWRLRAESDRFGDRDYVGFSYGYTYHAPGYAIHQVEDKASWELGGRATGNTWIMRTTFAPPVQKLDGTGFDSGWTLPGIANPYIFQHLPLITQLSGFTFQHDAEHALVTVGARPQHIRAYYHQDPGSDLLLHFNQHIVDLAEQVEIPARRVLVATIDHDETERQNHYLAVRDTIQGRIRAHYGVHAERARPAGTIEDWDTQSLANFPSILEWMHGQGLRHIFVQPLWRSNETDLVAHFGTRRDPEKAKRWGTLGNMCCVIEPEIADCYGGWEALKKAMEPARRLGLVCSTWYSNCFSSSSPLATGEPGFFARDQSGQFARNNYGHVLFANNNNSPAHLKVFQETMHRLKDCGFRAIFRDSHFNMGSDTIDWRAGGDPPYGAGLSPDQVGRQKSGMTLGQAQVRSMHDGEIGQMRFCQELGFTYFVESSGVMGLPQCGTSFKGVHGNEWLFDDMRTPYEGDDMAQMGLDPVAGYFRGLAHRHFLSPLVHPTRWPDASAHQAWWDPVAMAALNHGFLAVEDRLDQRRILPDGQGVAWRSADGGEVVFAYKDFTHRLAGRAEVDEMVAGGTQSVDGRLACTRHRIFRIRPT